MNFCFSPGLITLKRELTRRQFGTGDGTFISAGILGAPFVLTRTQAAGARATSLASDAATLAYYGADTPRFNGSAQRLLLEPSSVDNIRNPLGSGAVAGTPGTMPTNWTQAGGGGLSWNVVGAGTENNFSYLDVRLSGTSTTGAAPIIRADELYPAAAVGQTWTHSLYIRVVAGSLTGITSTLAYLTEWSAGPVFLGQQSAVIDVSAASMGTSRRSFSAALVSASTSLVGSQISITPVVSVPIDCTFRIAAPQLEPGSLTSFISPPSATPGVSTRGADLLTSSAANLGIAINGACTLLWSGVVPVFLPAGGAAVLALLDDGSDANRFFMRAVASSSNVQVQRDTAGVASSSVVGSITANTSFKVGLSCDGAGRVAVSLNGAAPVAVTGAPLSGFNTLRIGSTFGGASTTPQEILRFRALPGGVSDATLQSLVSALP